MTSKEIKSLTGIRGIAAIAVVLYHYMINWDVALQPLSMISWSQRMIFSFSYFVDLFFILSAFLMCLSYSSFFENNISQKHYKNYIVKRFARIYPVYFFSILIFIVYHIKETEIEKVVINISLAQIFFAKDLSYLFVYWSLSVEFFMYFIFPFLYRFVASSLIRKCLFFLVAISLTIVIPFLPSYFFRIFPFGIDFNIGNSIEGSNAFLRCFSDYLLGIVAFLVKDKFLFFKRIQYLVLVTLISAFFLTKAWIVYQILFTIVVILLYNQSKIGILFSNKIIYFMGLISYSVYINHEIVYYTLARFWRNSFLDIHWVALALTIVFSYITYRFIEIPGGKMIKKWLLR